MKKTLRKYAASSLLVLCASSANAALLAHYTYEADTVSGGSVSDQSGNNLNGGRSGGGNFTLSDTAIEGAKSLSNTSSIYATLDTTSDEVTIASWYKGTDTQGYFFDSRAGNRFICSTGRNSGGFIGGYVASLGSFINTTTSGSAIADNEWHHLAYVWGNDGTDATLQIYLDGTALTMTGGGTIATFTGEGMVNLDDADFSRVFSSNVSADALVGLVDDTRIYNHALTSLEIGALAAIPEPSAYGMIAGFLALGWVMLRRRA